MILSIIVTSFLRTGLIKGFEKSIDSGSAVSRNKGLLSHDVHFSSMVFRKNFKEFSDLLVTKLEQRMGLKWGGFAIMLENVLRRSSYSSPLSSDFTSW